MVGQVTLSVSADGSLATLTLGSPEERAIALTPGRMESLVEVLSKVKQLSPKGLVIRAPSLDSFCVGADIALIQSVSNPDEGARLAIQGQDAYNLLEDLDCITVAAISGPCVGGGCELVLACKYRIASDDPGTSIGLPETKLGILPGFGGTYRMPRVVGLPKALDIIVSGKTLRANQSAKSGLVDEVVSKESLYARAEQIARGQSTPKRRSVPFMERLLSSNPLGRMIVRRKAIAATKVATKGFYPAPIKAIEVTVGGLSRTRSDALRVEAKALGSLIVTPESKSLVHVFYLTETAKALGKSAKTQVEGMHALVIGAGTMGAGIALSLAKSGHQVIVKDTSENALDRGKTHIVKELGKLRYLSTFERASITNRIDWIQFTAPTLGRSDLVIEAVFEDINLKRKIFADLAPKLSASCIVASNTSSLSVSDMAASLPKSERFVGMHFFNPVEKMPLVEIIRGNQTSDETITKVAALTTRLGKFPIVVNDVPGFLVNRILIPYLNEAVYLLEEGHTVQEIDQAATEFGMPMGPIRLLDEVGLDVAAHVSAVMVKGYGDRMAVPPFAESLLKIGRKGRKNGRGFYNYVGKTASPWDGLTNALGLPNSPACRLNKEQLTERLIVHLVNEAMKCLQEGVAGSDTDLASKQIDLGTVMGIGFPPFRGGILYYANVRGLGDIRSKISKLHASFGSRYEPW